MKKQIRPLFCSFAIPLASFTEAAQLKVDARISLFLWIQEMGSNSIIGKISHMPDVSDMQTLICEGLF